WTDHSRMPVRCARRCPAAPSWPHGRRWQFVSSRPLPSSSSGCATRSASAGRRREEGPMIPPELETDVRTQEASPPSLAAALRQPRTILSIALPLVVLALVLANLPDFHLDRL